MTKPSESKSVNKPSARAPTTVEVAHGVTITRGGGAPTAVKNDDSRLSGGLRSPGGAGPGKK